MRRLAALLLLLSLAVALAQPRADTSTREALESEIAEYERLLEQRSAESATIEAELGETAAVLQQRIRERDNVSAQIADLRAQRTQLRAEIEQLEADLADTALEIERILADLDSLLERISALLVNLYTQGNTRYAAALSAASSYHDFQVRSHYLTLLTQQDVNLVNELNDTRAELLAAQQRQRDQLQAQAAAEENLRVNEEQLVVQQNTLAGIISELESSQAGQRQAQAAAEEKRRVNGGQLGVQQNTLAGIISELESTQAGQRAQQQALLQAQNEVESALGSLAGRLEAEIARLIAEEERLQREAAQAFLEERERSNLLRQAEDTRTRIENLTEPLLPTTSDYGFPVPGPTIASRFGQDNNSYLALRAANSNAPVTAIEAGVVQTVMLVSANDGYMVAILHGNDLLVSYTNLQQPLVTPGTRVSKGQLLGYLGGGTLVRPDILKLWVMVGNTFVDPQARLGF